MDCDCYVYKQTLYTFLNLHYILNKTMLHSNQIKMHIPSEARAKACHRLLCQEYFYILSHWKYTKMFLIEKTMVHFHSYFAWHMRVFRKRLELLPRSINQRHLIGLIIHKTNKINRETRLIYNYCMVSLYVRMRISDNVSLKTNNINVNKLTP